MAMVVSQKTKVIFITLLALFALGGILAIVSTLGLFLPSDRRVQNHRHHGEGGLAAKLSQGRTFTAKVDQEEGDAEGSGRPDAGAVLPPFPPPPPGIDDFPRGSRGEKGERGARGAPGESIRGPPGPPGPPGQPGPPGLTTVEEYIGSGSGDDRVVKQIIGDSYYSPSGQCACNSSEMLRLIALAPELRGPQGVPGPHGADGRAGTPGITGQPGMSGERGPHGPKGDRGDRGDSGPVGPEGRTGPKGEPGVDGKPGTQGPRGPPGPPGQVDFASMDGSLIGADIASSIGRPGNPGVKGDIGPPGPVGPIGERGFPGNKGERGDSGSKGPKGDRGHVGPQGQQGVKGERGPSGLDGLPGQPGTNGRPADKGEKGEGGPAGPPGPPGIPFNMFSADDGDFLGSGFGSGSQRERTDSAPSYRGIKGDVGSKGEKGNRGDEGNPGLPAKDGKPGERGEIGPSGMPGMEGPVGAQGLKGDRGERGPPGAVSVGGSSGDFITIKGEKGIEGPRGRRGKTGPQGSKGSSGPQGPPGPSGPIGDIGLPGWMDSFKGRPGIPGLPGAKGERGDSFGGQGSHNMQKGEKGDRGMDGKPGRDGSAGPPGPAASLDGVQYVPIPGPPGPPGPAGPPGVSIVGPKATRSPIDELKALKDIKDVRDYKDSFTEGPGMGMHDRGSYNEDSGPMKVVPGAVTFQNTEAMTKMSDASPVGTLAYIIEEEALLVRVNNGWQYIALGSLLPITTPAPPTTATPPIRPPFEASNLINNVPIPVEGPSWFPKMLRLAALNEAWSGDLHGVRGADYACYRQARRAGLRGTFRAFLSSRVQNIDSIVRWADRELPVVNIRGDVLFNSWAELFDGSGGMFSQAPRILSFSGKNILTDLNWPQKSVWHGSLANGERAMDTYCDAWHSSSPDKLGLAGDLRSNRLLGQNKYSCSSRFALLCIEATSQITRRRRDLSEYNDTSYAATWDEESDMSESEYGEFLDQINSDV